MSSAYEEKRKIIITMNPDELRSLADKMEEKFPTFLPGQSTFIDLFSYSDDLLVCLHADQQWFNKKEGEK